MKDPGTIPAPVFRSQQRTVDFSALANFTIKRLYAITNLTARQDIYDSGDPQLGYTAVNGAVVTLAYDTRPMSDGDVLQVFYEDGTAVLAGGAATAAQQDAGNATLASILAAFAPLGTDTSLQAILTVLQAQRAETLWTDDSGAFFVRIDVRGAITWTDPLGNASSGPATASARPAAGASMLVDSTRYQAIAAKSGSYAVGDYLAHIVTLDPKTGASVGDFWINATQATKLASPPSNADIQPIKPLPDGAATSALQTAGNGTLAQIRATLGTLATDADLQANTAKAEAIRALLAGTINVAAAALPLPAGAAKDASLQAILQALAGVLIVSGSAPVGSPPAVPPVPVSGVDGAGLKRHLLTDAAGRQAVTVASNAPRVTATGALGATNAAVTLAVDGMATAVVKLSGTWTGTVAFLGSMDDGATFDVPVNMIPYSGGAAAAAVGSATANGAWEMACGGLTHLRAVMSAYTSGSASALLVATAAPKSVRVGNPAGNPLTVAGTLAQGAAGASPWPVSWSGQSVGVSSLPPIPAGTNVIGAVTQSGGPWAVSGTVSATQSGAWTVVLGAGSAAIGSVTVSNFPATQAVSATSLPLPAGAATAAKQPALGTAGTPAADVLTVQGTPAGTPMPMLPMDLVPAGSPYSGSAAGVIGQFDTTGYASIDLYLTAYAGGNVLLEEQASDGSNNWQAVPLTYIQSVTQGLASTYGQAFVTGLWRASVGGKTMRIRIGSAPGGTDTVAVVLKSAPFVAPTTYVSNAALTVNESATAAAGGLAAVSRIVSAAAGTNAASAKGSAGRVYKVTGYNAANAVRWLRFFNLASAPTPGTSPAFFALALPLGAFDFGVADLGYFFSIGIGYALTTGPTDTDTGALTAGDVLNLNVWTA